MHRYVLGGDLSVENQTEEMKAAYAYTVRNSNGIVAARALARGQRTAGARDGAIGDERRHGKRRNLGRVHFDALLLCMCHARCKKQRGT